MRGAAREVTSAVKPQELKFKLLRAFLIVEAMKGSTAALDLLRDMRKLGSVES